MGMLVSPYRHASAGLYGSHRYWRIYAATNSGGSQTSIADLQFRATVGGADLTGSGTPLSGGSGSDVLGGEADKAFDGTLSSGWARTATATCWVGYDFGSAVSVAEASILPPSTQPERTPATGTLDYSDDGVSWTTATSFSFFAIVAQVARTVPEATPAAGTYRSLRINIATNNGDARVGIAEIEFRASIGGADQATGGLAKASSEFSGTFPAGAAFANNGTGSQWLSSTLSSEWIRYDFASPVSLAETMIQGYSSTVSRSPKDFTIQGSNDGTWTTLFSPPAQTGWTAGEIRTFS